MDIKELLGMGAIPVIIGIVELMKPWLGDGPDGRRWYPVAAVLVGAVLQVWIAIAGGDAGITAGLRAALAGAIAGLAASGLYSARKQFHEVTTGTTATDSP